MRKNFFSLTYIGIFLSLNIFAQNSGESPGTDINRIRINPVSEMVTFGHPLNDEELSLQGVRSRMRSFEGVKESYQMQVFKDGKFADVWSWEGEYVAFYHQKFDPNILELFADLIRNLKDERREGVYFKKIKELLSQDYFSESIIHIEPTIHGSFNSKDITSGPNRLSCSIKILSSSGVLLVETGMIDGDNVHDFDRALIDVVNYMETMVNRREQMSKRDSLNQKLFQNNIWPMLDSLRNGFYFERPEQLPADSVNSHEVDDNRPED